MESPVAETQGPSSKLDKSSVLPPALPAISTPLSVLAALPAGEWSLLQEDCAPGLCCGMALSGTVSLLSSLPDPPSLSRLGSTVERG